MKLEDIGFYTLHDKRAEEISAFSQMQRGEIIITDECNFKCPYCRGMVSECQGTLSLDEICKIIDIWALDGLKNIRFSGGEPTTHQGLLAVVRHAHDSGIERIAISTNGSAEIEYYKSLIFFGANDFSISLDSCCSSGVNAMAGIDNQFETITSNIRELSKITYVTVGIVLTDKNVSELKNIVQFAHDLGVADIRIISAAQWDMVLEEAKTIPEDILDAHPILKYRVNNILNGRNVRGIRETDCHKCHLVQDDSAIAGDYHFPCIIYMREQGEPIGKVGAGMREERIEWFKNHDTHCDKICSKNCLDVCIDFNNKCHDMTEKQ